MAEKIVVASGKGGVGKTTLTVAISKAMCLKGKKVLIIDCDCLRSVDLMVGTTEKTVYDWGDIAMGRCEASQAVYGSDDPSLWTMAAPESYDNLGESSLKDIVSKIEEYFDYIFIDAPAGIGKGLTLACSAADKALVVSTPDLVCVRSACTAARKINSSGIEDVRLIINRLIRKDVRKGRTLNLDGVIDSVEVQLIGVVPEDAKIRMGSMGADVYKKGQASYKAITNIAGRILGEYVPLS